MKKETLIRILESIKDKKQTAKNSAIAVRSIEAGIYKNIVDTCDLNLCGLRGNNKKDVAAIIDACIVELETKEDLEQMLENNDLVLESNTVKTKSNDNVFAAVWMRDGYYIRLKVDVNTWQTVTNVAAKTPRIAIYNYLLLMSETKAKEEAMNKAAKDTIMDEVLISVCEHGGLVFNDSLDFLSMTNNDWPLSIVDEALENAKELGLITKNKQGNNVINAFTLSGGSFTLNGEELGRITTGHNGGVSAFYRGELVGTFYFEGALKYARNIVIQSFLAEIDGQQLRTLVSLCRVECVEDIGKVSHYIQNNPVNKETFDQLVESSGLILSPAITGRGVEYRINGYVYKDTLKKYI